MDVASFIDLGSFHRLQSGVFGRSFSFGRLLWRHLRIGLGAVELRLVSKDIEEISRKVQGVK